MRIKEYKKGISLPLRQVTLCFFIRKDEILLAMKKKGFGKGWWNGVGGKPDKDEDIELTAIREAEEEIGLVPLGMKKVATLNFYSPHNPKWDQQVVVFLTEEWSGKPMETDEMRPKWFKTNDLPFEQMWPDDIHWLPLVLDGKIIEAEFLFDENKNVQDYRVNELCDY